MTSNPTCHKPRAPWRVGAFAASVLAAATAVFSAHAATPISAQERAAWKPTFTVIDHGSITRADVARAAANGMTIPYWEDTVVSPVDGNTYTYNMVGRSPYKGKTPGRAFLKYVPLAVRMHFADGTVLDANQPSACDSGMSIMDRFYKSPLFKKTSWVSNGVDVSGPKGEQLISAFQRASFWSVVHDTNWGVELVPNGRPMVVDVTAPSDSRIVSFPITCPAGNTVTISVGLIPIGEYDNLVESTIAPLASADQVPVFLTYNIVQTVGGGCCVIGYHNAIKVTNGVQVYSVGTYNDPGIFRAPISDIYAWSHELGELMDDPFVQGHFKQGRANNITPAWGGTGQVGGCQNNLEVGDPLTGVAVYGVDSGGFTYHYQDLAFKDWFYRTPSLGTGGLYSFQGTFTTDAGPVCH